MNTIRPKYKCTEQELYSVARAGWTNCSTYLADFTAYKAFYIAAYVTGKRNAITAAENLPEAEARVGEHELLKVQMGPLADLCLGNFQKLEGYIASSFPANELKTRSESAGKPMYRTASRLDWEDVVGLNTAMLTFIGDNGVALLAGGMPATFEAGVETDADNFSLKYNSYLDKRQTEVATGEKVTVNNGVYADLQTMFNDGNIIFRKDNEKKQLFNFTAIKNIVSPPGSASLKVTVKEAVTNLPLAGVTVNMQAEEGTPQTAQTDDTGVALFENIDPAVYTGSLTLATYTEAPFSKEVNTGTDSRMEAILVKI